MTKRNIINFEYSFIKEYDKTNTARKLYESLNRAVLASYNGDVLAVLSTR